MKTCSGQEKYIKKTSNLVFMGVEKVEDSIKAISLKVLDSYTSGTQENYKKADFFGSDMIITIGGTGGSGKNVVAEGLSKRLGYNYYVMGDIRRLIAKEMGITLEELNRIAEENPSTDIEVDKFQESLGKKEDNFIIVGRTSYHFIPHSFKIFLKVDLEEGARRILGADRSEESFDALEQAKSSLQRRLESDKKRYRKYYGIDPYGDLSQYDLVVDTTNMGIQEVIDHIIDKLEQLQKI